jgi:hypothetical protein
VLVEFFNIKINAKTSAQMQHYSNGRIFAINFKLVSQWQIRTETRDTNPGKALALQLNSYHMPQRESVTVTPPRNAMQIMSILKTTFII